VRVAEVGRVKSESLVEASGLVASRRQPGIYWTHNDGSDGVLHAIRRDGFVIARVRVDEKFSDWEDIAVDARGDLYLADVGNNSRDRKRITVYRVAEPDPQQAKSALAQQEWKLTFPAKPFDCESLFIWREHGYLISKVDEGEHAALYRFPLKPTNKRRQLEQLLTLPVDEPVTAASLSEDGVRLALLTRGKLYVFRIDGEFQNIAVNPPQQYTLPRLQAEGCCFTPDGVLVIAESGEILLVRTDAAPITTTRPSSRER
jgi:sugar lactone lactonase YvrE